MVSVLMSSLIPGHSVRTQDSGPEPLHLRNPTWYSPGQGNRRNRQNFQLEIYRSSGPINHEMTEIIPCIL